MTLTPHFWEAFQALEDTEWWVGRELDAEREKRGHEFMIRMFCKR